MVDSTISRENDGQRTVYRLGGTFDRAGAWALRDRIDREPAGEVLLDFSLVREFSDLAVAVLAHGLTGSTRRIVFRGLRQHQLRIFRYCGVAVEEMGSREPVGTEPAATPASPGAAEHRAS